MELSENEVMGLIRAAVDDAGGADQFADKIGVVPRYVDFILKGHRPPRGAALDAIGVKRVWSYHLVRQ